MRGGVLNLGDRENVEVAAGVENDDIVAIFEAAQLVSIGRTVRLIGHLQFGGWSRHRLADRRLRVAVRNVAQGDGVVSKRGRVIRVLKPDPARQDRRKKVDERPPDRSLVWSRAGHHQLFENRVVAHTHSLLHGNTATCVASR